MYLFMISCSYTPNRYYMYILQNVVGETNNWADVTCHCAD